MDGLPVDDMLRYISKFAQEYENRIFSVKQLLSSYAKEIKGSGKQLSSGAFWINPESHELSTARGKWVDGGKSQGFNIRDELNTESSQLLDDLKSQRFQAISQFFKSWKTLDFYNAIGRFDYNTSMKASISYDPEPTITLESKMYVYDNFNFDTKALEFQGLQSLVDSSLRNLQNIVPDTLVGLGMANNYEQTGVSTTRTSVGRFNTDGSILWLA
jgi:hypothetical protein